MESVLIVITVVSLAMTIAFGAILARLVRNERRRSDARVAALREMADATALPVEPVELADDFELSLAADAQSVSDLFVREEPNSAWPRRLAVVAVIAIIATLAAGALRSRSTAPDLAGHANTRTASTQTVGLLELLSLKQTQGTGALTITGLVQNPRDGAVLSNVRATALLFAPDGTFLASGGAALDFTVLRPGDESGFVINVPVTSTVARYRVGFRSEDGHVIGHVDRRSAATMASGGDPVSSKPRGAS
jgi:hypothetical protein